MTTPTMLHRLTAEFIGTFGLVPAVAAVRFSLPVRIRRRLVGIGFLVSHRHSVSILDGVYYSGPSRGSLRPGRDAGRRPRSPCRVEGAARIPDRSGAWRAGRGAGDSVGGQRQRRLHRDGNMAADGYGEDSPGGYSLLPRDGRDHLDPFFLLVILALPMTARRRQRLRGPIDRVDADAIHLISIPIRTRLSTRPAPPALRSTATVRRRSLGVLAGTPARSRDRGIAYRTCSAAPRNSPTSRSATTLWRTAVLLDRRLLLALRAAPFSVVAPRLASCPPEFSRWARTNHWNFSSSPAWPMKRSGTPGRGLSGGRCPYGDPR